MADIFISYSSRDQERAKRIANALESCGWSVWWDRKITTGQAFDEAIERELEAAKCVIVLWSQESIGSEWVKSEASVAAERSVIVPALIDRVKLPLEFRRKQTADLVGWDGSIRHEGFKALCKGVADKVLADTSAQLCPTVAVPFSRTRPAFSWKWISVPLLVVVLGLLGYWLWIPDIYKFSHVELLGNKPDESTGKEKQETDVARTYNVEVSALPATANHGAQLQPNSVTLELHTVKDIQKLMTLNYPVSKLLVWSPQISTDVVLSISIGDIVLTKKYSGRLGFPEFLRDFHKGNRVFRINEFSPEESKILKGIGIEFLSISFIIRGAEPVMQYLSQ